MWKEVIFSIDQFDEEFQIVIEAIAGPTQYSDIAIDDLYLMNGADCINDKYFTTAEPIEETGGVFDVQSCANRCNETRSTGIFEEDVANLTGHGGVILHCDCYDGCEDIKTCCLDYRSVCVFGNYLKF